ncbi:MAG: Nif3-like dinuclear metal center hexameric protein [Planctomycetia bacterium]|nr:Nif3-like dinuclear metal center hexameric protein [Planctomycetia bacterium]
MTQIADVVSFLERFAPPELAAEWDNVGLLLGDRARNVERVMTCLTVTDAVVAEAIAERVDLIVSHHPLPFRAPKTITTETHDGRRLWRLASAGISIYSPHTAFDSAAEGINQSLAVGLGLVDIRPLIAIVASNDSRLGVGRQGKPAAPLTVAELVARVKAFLKLRTIAVAGADDKLVRKVAVGCGSAADLLADATAAGCDCFVTGEASFHKAIEAEASDTALLLVGHYASERFGVERLAERLGREFAQLTVWAARREQDALRYA